MSLATKVQGKCIMKAFVIYRITISPINGGSELLETHIDIQAARTCIIYHAFMIIAIC